MTIRKLHTLATYGIAAVWLINGLLCKVLGLVARHEMIVARILDASYAAPLTLLIGLGEIGIACWLISGYRIRLLAAVQIALVAGMNILEFILVPDLLLWGKLNSVFAMGFILLLYWHGRYAASWQQG